MSNHPHWRATHPTDEEWRPVPNLNARERTKEQDLAAGGRASRVVELPDGRTVTASIELKVPRGRRVYAYLRFTVDGKTHNRYIGQVDHATRKANLALAWRKAHQRHLVEWDAGRR